MVKNKPAANNVLGIQGDNILNRLGAGNNIELPARNGSIKLYGSSAQFRDNSKADPILANMPNYNEMDLSLQKQNTNSFGQDEFLNRNLAINQLGIGGNSNAISINDNNMFMGQPVNISEVQEATYEVKPRRLEEKPPKAVSRYDKPRDDKKILDKGKSLMISDLNLPPGAFQQKDPNV